jgi:hypothetical protein
MWKRKVSYEPHLHSEGGRIATLPTLSEIPQDHVGKESRF